MSESRAANMMSDKIVLPMTDTSVSGSYFRMLGETYYRIHRYDQIPPFFMSIISSADHWLFISSTGGLTAGRVNAESALFPYYTDDKIAENLRQYRPGCLPLRATWRAHGSVGTIYRLPDMMSRRSNAICTKTLRATS